jgi:cellulose synthase/poly-beta-1,6-N-acetylglucosamine synthase-like glycosyltransferase
MRTVLTAAAVHLAAFVFALLVLAGLDSVGVDASAPLGWVVVGGAVVISAALWGEALSALPRARVPPVPGRVPTATAVIAAYLPNEQDVIEDTVHAVLASDYPGRLEVVLAYNAPEPLPVVRRLRALADADPRFVLMHVSGSRSKAENVNAAAVRARGEFIAIFDADHRPERGCLLRAWRWIAAGADVVQGRCVVRDGGRSWLTRLISVEFEGMYGVTHPGRARTHGFGIFGGSNGYWRADVLRAVALDPQALTEDIDASIRALGRGARIVNDPGLVSRELAPTTVAALWHQRTRWAQGWHQVARRQLAPALGSGRLGPRARVGVLHLLLLRELFPWLSLLTLPLVAYGLLRGDGLMLWSSTPAIVATAVAATAVPAQLAATLRLAHPDIRQSPRSLALYTVCLPFYAEFKNVVSRMAQIRELTGRQHWIVTPRASPTVRREPSRLAAR